MIHKPSYTPINTTLILISISIKKGLQIPSYPLPNSFVPI